MESISKIQNHFKINKLLSKLKNAKKRPNRQTFNNVSPRASAEIFPGGRGATKKDRKLAKNTKK